MQKHTRPLQEWTSLLLPTFIKQHRIDQNQTPDSNNPRPNIVSKIPKKQMSTVLAAVTHQARKTIPHITNKTLQTAREILSGKIQRPEPEPQQVTRQSNPTIPEPNAPVNPEPYSQEDVNPPEPIQNQQDPITSQIKNCYKNTTKPIKHPSMSPKRTKTNLTSKNQNNITIHHHQGNKYRNWSLTPQKPIIIMGDSNLKRLPSITDQNIQVDCYPGARIKHAIHILRNKTPPTNSTQKIILSFGINDKDDPDMKKMKKEFRKLSDIANSTFPLAEIFIPLLNFSKNLTQNQKYNLMNLNKTIQLQHPPQLTIKQIPDAEFRTEMDLIHWTPSTAQTIIKNWFTHLK